MKTVAVDGFTLEIPVQDYDATQEMHEESGPLQMEKIIRAGIQRPKRFNLHASDMLKNEFKWHSTNPDFCYRQCVLAASNLYEPSVTFHNAQTLMVFENGWYVHERWQKIFEASGVALAIELTHNVVDDEEGTPLDEENPLQTFHPDAIIDYYKDGTPWVVEIKGYGRRTYESYIKQPYPPSDAHKQCQWYMHLTGIYQGLVLIECKDNQQYHIWEIKYDPSMIVEPITRFNTIVVMTKDHLKTGRTPGGICAKPTEARALECAMRDACFMHHSQREQIRAVKQGAVATHDIVVVDADTADKIALEALYETGALTDE